MRQILGVRVEASTYDDLCERCLAWAKRGESRAVFFANVHMLMEAFDHPGFRAGLNAADMVNPDGMPLVWSLRAMGQRGATRVYGPDATQLLLRAAEKGKSRWLSTAEVNGHSQRWLRRLSAGTLN